MEFFNTTKAVKLRSHLDKYLVADDNQESVHQSRNGASRKARWTVELVDNKSHVVRLKSCHGLYLAAADHPFLLGMTGRKVLQAEADKSMGFKFEWEPIRDGFQLKLRTWCSKYLLANGGPPPWRNAVTHDDPTTSSTQTVIMRDKTTGQPRGFGFVVSSDPSVLDRVLNDKHTIDARVLQREALSRPRTTMTHLLHHSSTQWSSPNGPFIELS
ncbi:PREDICTED: actin cross-linking [Prunus dulcis]|uniref:PREDICTED: actin cross-linking n=1 Tax=Prunus dulcis TaxID=3755 RepID=A0A5E4GNC3_PRUDU|nr:uncharacterized protein LOC117635193 [Prunus dulcis]VVA41397.1 PREDICTED: actin cross-linking [Prunus dulcis]